MIGRRFFPLFLCLFLSVVVLSAISLTAMPVAGQSVTGWVQEAKLVADDGAEADRFGVSVAIDGDTIVAGADGNDHSGESSGAAYVFVWNGTTWSQQAKLVSDDLAPADLFGISTSIDADTAVVGALKDDDNGSESGSAYVFVRSGDEWTQQAKLVPDDGDVNEEFGWSVAVEGDTAVAGARYDDENGQWSGSAYIFTRTGSVWTQQTKLPLGLGSAEDYFGWSVAVDGNTVVVGAVGDNDNGSDSGSVSVFVWNGSTWEEQTKLLAADGAAGDWLGGAVAIQADTAVAGAPYDDVDGARCGSAYVFVRSGGGWSQQAKLVPSDCTEWDEFGHSVALDGDTAVIGAHFDGDNGEYSGSAYVFVRDGSTWTQVAKLLPDDGATGEQFAHSAGISGNAMVLGAPSGSDNGTYTGSAYVFRFENEPPLAANDYAAMLVDNPALIDVAANDTDPDGNLDPASVALISSPAHGSAENHGDGTMTYTPDPGWSGADSFDYEIFDSEGLSDTATVHLLTELEGMTRYVAPTGSDSSFCTDPENPCLTVQYALDAGHDWDYVKVAEGIYSDLHVRPRADITSTGEVIQVVYVDTSATVEGGYTTSNWDTPDPEAHPTIIDPGGGGRGVYVTGDIEPTLAGLRIQYGDATGMGGWPNPWNEDDEDGGGGIYVISATATIRDNKILSNTAQNQGLLLIFSDATVDSNLVSGNNWGGAQLYECGATVTHNTISDNDGPGMSVMFDNCSGEGYCRPSVVSGNTMAANTGHGLYMFLNSATIDGNYIALNSEYDGAGLYLNLCQASVSNNVFAGNHADASGGAVYLVGDGHQVPKLMNNTFVDNTAGDGIGIYTSSWGDDPGTFDLSNSIVASHTVGIYADAGTTVILDGVLWHNTPVTATHSATSTVIVDHQHTGDPEFVWPAGGDYHISPTSAARDTGAWALWHTDYDIDGQPRRMGWAPDTGVDEYPDARLTLESHVSPVLVRGGDPLTYTLVITSDGVKSATGAVVTASMDDWQRATGVSSTQGPCTITDPNWGGEVECTPGTVVTGTEVVVTILAEVSPDVPIAQPMTCTAEVMANESGWTDWAHTVTPGNLTYPLEQDPWTLDPSLVNDEHTGLLLAQLMEGLYRTGPESEMEPAGALSHQVSGDFQTYTVTLRADAVWSDGEPVVAQHYVDGMIRMLDPGTGAGRAYLLYILENAWEFNSGDITDPDLVGVHALSDTTLEFTLREPAARFPSMLGVHATYPVRLDLIGSDPDWTEPGHLVGTGAYVLAAHLEGEFLILEKNPLYYGADGVHFGPVVLPILSAEQQLAAYEDGLVDVSLVPADEVDRIISDPVLEAEYNRTQARGLYQLGLNTQLEATDEVLVRQALASAIDREAILVDVLNQPRTEAATSVIPPNVPGYQNGEVGYPFDPVQAQTYLAQAGYPGGAGFPALELWANFGHEETIEAVADQWRDVLGITVINFYRDWPEYVSALSGCREDPGACPYGAYRLGWIMNYADAYSLLGEFLHPDSEYQFTGWDNQDYRDLIEWSRTEPDPVVRTGYFQEADRILVEEEAAVIPIYYTDYTALIKWDVLYEYPSLFDPFLMKWRRAAGPVVLSIEPPETTIYLGQQFEVSVLVQAGEQEVDGAAGYLNFDPDVLQVVSISEGDSLPMVIVNEFDNLAGSIDYAAGTFGPDFPTGSFDLVTVIFEAIAASEETTVEFSVDPPRESDATFGGASVLHHTEDGNVVVSDKASLIGSVALQGRPDPPHPRWSVPLTVKLYPPGGGDPAYEFSPTTDESGTFTVTGILPDTYAVLVKHSHTLQNREDVALVLGPNPINLGELREGDADDDNCVDLVDFSILATTYALGQGDPGFDPRADFNGDGWITLLDFSLLVTNFGVCGEEPPGGAVSEPIPPRPAGVDDDVYIVVQPPLSIVEPGDIFTVSVEVQAGSQLVDGAQASIDFDPALLQVVEMTGNTDALPVPLWSTYDNTLGTLDYAAGAFSDFPSGSFILVEIAFESMAPTPGTPLAFHFELPRMTDVTFGGYSVLTGYMDGEVRCATEHRLHLPVVLKSF